MALSDMKTAATVAYPLNEASGVAIDDVGALDLTDRNTVGSGTGLLYAAARDFEAANSEGFSRADDAAYSVGDIDFFIVAWVNPEAPTGAKWIVAKGNTGSANFIPYSVNLDASNKVRVIIGNGTTHTIALASAAGLSNGAWHLVIVYHDSVNNLIGISIDGGSFETFACSHGSHDDTAAFVVGDLTTGAFIPFDGLMNDVVLGKGYIPTNADATALWNSGTGVAFANWDAGGGSSVSPDLLHSNLLRSHLLTGLAR